MSTSVERTRSCTSTFFSFTWVPSWPVNKWFSFLLLLIDQYLNTKILSDCLLWRNCSSNCRSPWDRRDTVFHFDEASHRCQFAIIPYSRSRLMNSQASCHTTRLPMVHDAPCIWLRWTLQALLSAVSKCNINTGSAYNEPVPPFGSGQWASYNSDIITGDKW